MAAHWAARAVLPSLSLSLYSMGEGCRGGRGARGGFIATERKEDGQIELSSIKRSKWPRANRNGLERTNVYDAHFSTFCRSIHDDSREKINTKVVEEIWGSARNFTEYNFIESRGY